MTRILLLFWFLPSFCVAQNVLSGNVLEAEGNAPVFGASVFLNNTTIGDVTDSKGNFLLKNVSAGKHELIVSMVGYEKVSVLIETPSNKPLLIKLKEKPKELNQITVTPFEKDGWQKWGKYFTEIFIGTTENSEKTKLKNWKDVRFRHHKAEGKLEIVATKPLKIENKSLGYEVEYHLEVCEIDFKKGTTMYAGFPFFKENKKISKAQLKNRQETYDASLIKFMKSLYHNTITQDGYLVRKLIVKENLERKRVQELYKKYTIREVDSSNNTISVTGPIFPEGYTVDSLDYFRKVLEQPRETSHLIKDTLSTADLITTKNTQTKVLYFDDHLHVINKNFKEDKRFVSLTRPNSNPGPQTSLLILADGTDLEIQENGNYYSPLDLYSGEYWGWSNKVADLLPLDYKPRSSTP